MTNGKIDLSKYKTWPDALQDDVKDIYFKMPAVPREQYEQRPTPIDKQKGRD